MDEFVSVTNMEKFFNNVKNRKYLENEYYNYCVDFAELCKIIASAKKQNIKLAIMYDIISFLSDFNVNKKSISCVDMLNNKVYLKENNKYKFYLNCFRIFD